MSQERDTDVRQVLLYMSACISLTVYIFLMALGPPYCPFKGDPHLYGAFRVCVCVSMHSGPSCTDAPKNNAILVFRGSGRLTWRRMLRIPAGMWA